MSLDVIQKELRALSTQKTLDATRKFVPSAQSVYGVKMPDVNALAQKYKIEGFELVKQLWQSGFYEERILAAKILGKIGKKDPFHVLRFIKKNAKDISDWATCDTLGMQGIHGLRKTHQKEIFELSALFSKSKNLWLRRLSLVLLEHYTRFPECEKYIKKRIRDLSKDEEYYVKKAVSWIERNYRVGR